MTLPRVTTVRIRDIHRRGVDRCIRVLKMTDLREIAEACNLPTEEHVKQAMRPEHNMLLANNRKRKKKAEEPLEEDDSDGSISGNDM